MGDGIVKPRLLFANNAGVGLFDPVGRAFGYAYSNGDVSPDARGDVRTDARDGSAVLRADDGYVRTVGRADGHGGAFGFRSADRRALDAPRATASRNPSSSSSSSSSSLPRA